MDHRRGVVLAGGLAAVVLSLLGVLTFARGEDPPVAAQESMAAAMAAAGETAALELPPLRAYPPIDIADLAPDRPPFVELKGFPPPPPAVRFSSGPIRRFSIPRLEVDHAIEVLSMSPTGELPTPSDANYRVGWYVDFGQPGSGGNALFTAHETWNHLQAPFFNLHRAQVGDDVVVDMADGRRLFYMVFSNIRYDARTIPMNELIWPAHKDAEWITLITCGGRIVYDPLTGFGEYLDRDVVVARRIG